MNKKLIKGYTEIKPWMLKNFSEIERKQLIKELQDQKRLNKFLKKTFNGCYNLSDE